MVSTLAMRHAEAFRIAQRRLCLGDLVVPSGEGRADVGHPAGGWILAECDVIQCVFSWPSVSPWDRGSCGSLWLKTTSTSPAR